MLNNYTKYRFSATILIIFSLLVGSMYLRTDLIAKAVKKSVVKASTKKPVKSTKSSVAKPAKKLTAKSDKKNKVKKVTSKTDKKSKSKKELISKSSKNSKNNKSKIVKKTKSIKVKSLTDDSNIKEVRIDTLSKGVIYKELMVGDGKLTFNVNVIEADIANPQNLISIMKADGLINELSKLQDINHEFDSINNPEKTILGSVNGNFWKAYTNYPIGPVIVNGEIVEMNSYKNWSSAFFDSRNRMYIDRFMISGNITSKKGLSLNIDAVNRRSDSSQIVIYNYFGGDSIPYVPKKNFIKAMSYAFQDIEFRDSSDIEFDSLEFKKEVRSAQRINMLEYTIPKLTLKYLTPVAINKRIPCIVVAYDSFAVKTSQKTCILSLGKEIERNFIPKIGDTLYLKYETNLLSNTIFTNAVCGTPRLVRNGEAKQEAEFEGSSGRRFIHGQLPRTAIGTNKSMNKIFIVAVSPTMGSKQCVGASLCDLAMIMKLIGCNNALNLDGGGSTIMAIDGKNVLYQSNPDISRRLSVGIGIATKKKNKFWDAMGK
jgi:hypothetical protein